MSASASVQSGALDRTAVIGYSQARRPAFQPVLLP
jgi:hypothetical protein